MPHLLTPGKVILKDFAQQGEGIKSTKFPGTEEIKDVVQVLFDDYGVRTNNISIGKIDRDRLDRRPLSSADVQVTFNPADTDLVRDLIENELSGGIVER